MKKGNWTSEAAVRRAIKFSDQNPIGVSLEKVRVNGKVRDIVLSVESHDFPYRLLCEISLKDYIKKRKPLTGVNKKLKEIVRGSKAKKTKKRSK